MFFLYYLSFPCLYPPLVTMREIILPFKKRGFIAITLSFQSFQSIFFSQELINKMTSYLVLFTISTVISQGRYVYLYYLFVYIQNFLICQINFTKYLSHNFKETLEPDDFLFGLKIYIDNVLCMCPFCDLTDTCFFFSNILKYERDMLDRTMLEFMLYPIYLS